ncbi:MAG: M1 family metallopeptidase [Gemmatimonadales bacterium]
MTRPFDLERSVILAAILLLPQQAAPASNPNHYWQQQVAYEISARLDEPRGVLSGTERIRYVNRSPDTLSTFSLHLYLNAFRPGSRWSDADSTEGRRRFNDLREPNFAFNHVRNTRIGGTPVKPMYPFAPDSTVVRYALPQPLPPGDSVSVDLEWDARPSTVPRRQGRQGRRFDFAQWYPKVVVYDRYGWEEHPLYPAGEFYGEFATFLVDLDVPADQVMGATGVPVCGDPGWERANRNRSRPIDYRRDFYGPDTPPAACDGAAAGRKIVRWYARDVHHFAISLNPDYRYEGGRYGNVAVHVLYQPGDENTWGGNFAVERTQTALAWLGQLYGPFAWPQITNVHRIEGGGTEFPMIIMNGSADQGLIVHELGHNYTMGILANNEWREGWLDEGFTSFQTDWFWEMVGRPSTYPETEAGILQLDLDDYSEPPSLVAEKYRDFSSYNTAIYTRGKLFFQQLRYIVGDDTMHRILQTFYQRWKLKHVDEAAFRAVAEEVSQRDLSTFFAQWLHTTELYDYGVGEVRTERGERGAGWVTRVEVVRRGNGRIPVEVGVVAEQDTAVARVDGLAEREWLTLKTRSKPKEVVLDPRMQTHDWNMLNNRKRLGGLLPATLLPPPGSDFYFHPYFSTRSRRERLTVGVQPTLWYNDAGGVTVGIRSRDDYLGRFEQNVAMLTGSTGWGVDNEVKDIDFFLRAKNPVVLRAPNLSQTFDAYKIEGRYGAAATLEWSRRAHLTFGPTRSHRVSLRWVGIDDTRYLDPGYYDDVGIVELQFANGISNESGQWNLSARSSLGGGLAYNRDGLAAGGRSDLDPFYFNGFIEGIARRDLAHGLGLAVRGYLAAGVSDHDAAKQRQVYFQGSDPLSQLYNPFLRSRGALLVRDDFNYQSPGGAGIRGVDPRLSTSAIAALNLEVEQGLLSRPESHLFKRISIAAFSDLAQGIGSMSQTPATGTIRFVSDAGLGIRAAHRIGDTEFVTRFDFPLFVSRPELAQDATAGDDDVAFRWVFSFEQPF